MTTAFILLAAIALALVAVLPNLHRVSEENFALQIKKFTVYHESIRNTKQMNAAFVPGAASCS